MHFTSEELIAITAVASAIQPFGWCLLVIIKRLLNENEIPSS